MFIGLIIGPLIWADYFGAANVGQCDASCLALIGQVQFRLGENCQENQAFWRFWS